MTVIGCGIIGCGGAAAEMCCAMGDVDGVAVTAVFDRVEERAAQFAEAYGGTAHASADALLADESVDVVYVALPHHLLAATAERALSVEKHVLVEKPLGLTAAEIASLAQFAAAQNLLLVPVFELRSRSVFREARRMIENGAIGSVKAVRMRTVIDKPPTYWRVGTQSQAADGWRARLSEAGGGVLLMNSIHQLDLVRFMTGIDVVAAFAATGTLFSEVEVEDSAAAVLRFANGAIGSVVAAAHSPGADFEERIEIDGSEGRIDLPDPHGADGSTLRIFLRRDWGGLEAGRWNAVDAGESDMYADYLRDFIRAVAGSGTPAASAQDATAAVATVMAMYESAATGRLVAIAAD